MSLIDGIMENLEMRRVKLSDINQLQKICRQTFFETFSDLNTEENMKKYLEEGFSIEKLEREIQNEYSVLYFAVLDNDPIGYLKINFRKSQTEVKEDNFLEIERIYVLQKFLGKKIGSYYAKRILLLQNKKTWIMCG